MTTYRGEPLKDKTGKRQCKPDGSGKDRGSRQVVTARTNGNLEGSPATLQTNLTEDITMKNINIKDLLGNGEMAYNTLYTEDKFEWFKSDKDAYIYVLNTETKRCTRYNAEAQNGKRISVDEYETKMAEALHKETTANEESKMVEITDEEAFEEALERAEEDIITEEGQEVVREMKKEKKAKRAKKNIAFSVTHDGIEISLTEKQVDFINHLPDTNFWEHGLDSCIWVDCLCDDIGGQFANKPMTVGAMISTLCEKGLGVRTKERMNGRKCTSFELTELGKKVAKELGLN